MAQRITITRIVIALVLLLATAGPMAFGQLTPATQPGPATRPMPRVPDGVTAHRDIEYAKVGNMSLLLDIYTPSGTPGALPLVVWVHGGGWRAGSKENGTPIGMVGRGYVVASINYRLSQEAIFPAQIEDCKAAIRFLRANAPKYGIDPRHIGVWGSSAGGHLVALLGTSGDVKELEGQVGGNLDFSSRVQCVVDYCGPADFMAFKDQQTWVKVDQPDSPLVQLVGGMLADKPEQVRRANPITYITSDDPPFLVAHGDKDDTVPLNQSQLLVAALNKAGVEATFELVQGAGHGFNAEQSQRMNRIVNAFMDKHLKATATTQPAAH